MSVYTLFTPITTILSLLKEQKNIAIRNVSWPQIIPKTRLWPGLRDDRSRYNYSSFKFAIFSQTYFFLRTGIKGLRRPTERLWLCAVIY